MRVRRVTGAWTQLLTDWLDREKLPAADLRTELATLGTEEIVPMRVWRSLLERAAALRPGLPAPGLAIGSLVQPRHVGVMGYLALASDTLGEAMLVYQRYERLFYGIEIAEVVVVGNDIELRWPHTSPPASGLVDAVAIAALITFIRRLTGSPPPPTLIGIASPAPADSREIETYTTFFQCPVRFADSHTRVRFPASYLAIRMPHGDPGLRTLLDRQAQALLRALPDPEMFDRAVQQVMLKLLPDGMPTVPRAAAALHLSVRTLQRRLEASGATWQGLLDRTREQLARQYLLDRGLSIGEIALLLGFSEQSAFNRAFRRWTAETPARYRKRAIGNQAGAASGRTADRRGADA